MARNRLRRGQAITEYAILLGVVAAALFGMQLYAKRSLQAGLKSVADRLGEQATAIQAENEADVDEAASESQTAVSNSVEQQLGGAVVRRYDEQQDSRGALSGRGPDVSRYTESYEHVR